MKYLIYISIFFALSCKEERFSAMERVFGSRVYDHLLIDRSEIDRYLNTEFLLSHADVIIAENDSITFIRHSYPDMDVEGRINTRLGAKVNVWTLKDKDMYWHQIFFLTKSGILEHINGEKIFVNNSLIRHSFFTSSKGYSLDDTLYSNIVLHSYLDDFDDFELSMEYQFEGDSIQYLKASRIDNFRYLFQAKKPIDKKQITTGIGEISTFGRMDSIIFFRKIYVFDTLIHFI